MPVITPYGIRAVAQWAALCAALSVELSLVESQVAAEEPAEALALARLLVAQHEAFKGPHYSIGLMHVASVVAGRNASPCGALSALGHEQTFCGVRVAALHPNAGIIRTASPFAPMCGTQINLPHCLSFYQAGQF